jgi:hypothetical protein
MDSEQSTQYPCFCNCCEVPVSLKNKQAKYFHTKNSKTAKILRGEIIIMTSKSKKAKMEYKNAGEEFLYSKMDLFIKNVLKDNFHTSKLESNVEDLEEDLEIETRIQIRDICQKKIDEWEEKIEEIREKTTTHYDASSDKEKDFLRSLSAKTVQLAEVYEQGNHHAGIPPTYNLTENDLQFLLNDMNARVRAIEYEILRRQFEPEKIVYDYFITRYANRRRDGYTQDFN